MKYLVFLVSIISGINGYAQNPNPELFQTWYLTYVQSNDLTTPIKVVEVLPAVTPSLTISNDLNFVGQGACNSFNGTFINATSDTFQTTQFFQTLLTCNSQMQNTFEATYFDFLKSARFYQIRPEGQGLILSVENPLFGSSVFQNYPLKTNDFDIEKILIYPNPTNSKIYLNLNQLVVSKIQVINSLGQNVKTIMSDFDAINISDLSSGIYILKINTVQGTINKKVVKE